MYQVEGQGKGPCILAGHAESSPQVLMGRCALGQRCCDFRGNLNVSQGSYGSDIHENLKKKFLAPHVLLTDLNQDTCSHDKRILKCPFWAWFHHCKLLPLTTKEDIITYIKIFQSQDYFLIFFFLRFMAAQNHLPNTVLDWVSRTNIDYFLDINCYQSYMQTL